MKQARNCQSKNARHAESCTVKRNEKSDSVMVLSSPMKIQLLTQRVYKSKQELKLSALSMVALARCCNDGRVPAQLRGGWSTCISGKQVARVGTKC